MADQCKCKNGLAVVALLVAIASAGFTGLQYLDAETIHQEKLSEIQYQAYIKDGTVTLHQTGGTTQPLSQIHVQAWFQKDPSDPPSKGEGFPLTVTPLTQSGQTLNGTFLIENINSIICQKEKIDCAKYDIKAIDLIFKVHEEKRKVWVRY